jgi:lysophospholipase L1-like esterase
MERLLIVTAFSLSLLSPVFGDAPKVVPSKDPAAVPVKSPLRPEPVDPRLKTPIDHLDFNDGDTVVFLGDSITNQCLYTQYLEDFYYTRFPHTKISFHNAGVGGDRAFHALERFEADVAAYKPKYVTLLLGGNDAKDKQWDPALFAIYEKEMIDLLDKIKAIGATAIVISPTMYDRRSLLIKPTPKRPYDGEGPKYTNAVMAYYGAFMRDLAVERGLNFVDVFAPLNKLSIEQRFKDPNFTMIPDAWHPKPDGHVIIATAFLDAIHAPRDVSSTQARLDAKGWNVTVAPGGKVTDIEGDANHLSFIAQEPALPWILPADAALGYEISGAGHLHSAQPLQIQGLAAGSYELKIDGESVGVFPASLLASKIELQNFKKTPQYQQALAVAMLNQEKNDKAMRPIRNLYRELKINRPVRPTPEFIAASMKELKAKVAVLEKLKGDYEQKILPVR